MSGDLRVINRQRTRAVDTRELRRMVVSLLADGLSAKEFDLTIHLVGNTAMARLNWEYLRHEGPTDVITLDYGTTKNPAGEIFICVEVAVEQARSYGVLWQEELLRYAIHGVLHLKGYDDRQTAARRRMRREEAQRLKELGQRFRLRKLARKTKLRV
jgi:probable rRNA maturation factor